MRKRRNSARTYCVPWRVTATLRRLPPPMLVQMLEDEIAALRGLPEAAVPAPDA